QDKQARPDAKTDFLARNARSVLSKRTMDEIAAQADRVWSSRGAKPNGKPTSAANGKSKSSGKGANRGKALTATTKKTPRKRASSNGTSARLTSAAAAKMAGGLSKARRSNFPKDFRPQLATLSTDIPRGEEWLHEI